MKDDNNNKLPLEKLKRTLEDARPLILWAELAGLMHDVGKLSSAFYTYRRTWRTLKDGYDQDPHDHQFLDKYDKHIILKDFKILKDFFEKPPPTIAESYFKHSTDVKGKRNCSIKRIIHEHIAPWDDLTRLLKAADSKDSAIDRNNPLYAADQTGEITYDADVFGYENYDSKYNIKDIAELDSYRAELYRKLQPLLDSYYQDNAWQPDKRQEVHHTIQEDFKFALSDTTRPDNDTSLWEHCYSVASLFRVLVAHKIIYDELLDDFDSSSFGILGIGWDSLAFLARSEKIGDIHGRKDVLESTKQFIKELVEYKYSLGNSIYEDDDGLYFLVPRAAKEFSFHSEAQDIKFGYSKLLIYLKEEIDKHVLEQTDGDLQPQFYMVPDTKYITHITQCIRGIRERTGWCIAEIGDSIKTKLLQPWLKPDTKSAGDKEKGVCPLCMRRPVISREQLICQTCNKLRQRVYKDSAGKQRDNKEIEKNEQQYGTPFISEIAQANMKLGQKRACLVVARFHLDHWLDGRMIRSLFITESRGLEAELTNLGNTCAFAADEKSSREWLEHTQWGNLVRQGYDYGRIKEEIERCYNFANLTDKEEENYARNTVFLYDRRIVAKGQKENILNRQPEIVNKQWKYWLESTREEYGPEIIDDMLMLPNILCSKTPTPSTILDIWKTTESFFKEIPAAKEGGRILGIEPRSRISVQVEMQKDFPLTKLQSGAALSGHIKKNGNFLVKEIEIVNLQDISFLIGVPAGIKLNEYQNTEVYVEGKPLGRTGFVLLGTIQSVSERYKYSPLRLITTSPNMFMAIVPADKALPVTEYIYSAYLNQFGKVMGRLPLSIGNIFFEQHTPMFIVLDAARRMVGNFELIGQTAVEIKVSNQHITNLSTISREGISQDNTVKNINIEKTEDGNKTNQCLAGTKLSIKMDQIKWPNTPPLNRSFEWRLPYVLGDGQNIDYYHPYFIVKKEPAKVNRYSSRKSYFKTIAGDAIHFTDVQAGDTLLAYPNYYDFEFLDVSTRRFDLVLDESRKRRRSSATGFFSKPYLLDDIVYAPLVKNAVIRNDKAGEDREMIPFGLGLCSLWRRITGEKSKEAIMANITDTQLRNIESLWLEKLNAWRVDIERTDTTEFKEWAELVETTLKKEFTRYRDLPNKNVNLDFQYLKEAVLTGLFFDCLEIYLRILKERIRVNEEDINAGKS